MKLTEKEKIRQQKIERLNRNREIQAVMDQKRREAKLKVELNQLPGNPCWNCD